MCKTILLTILPKEVFQLKLQLAELLQCMRETLDEHEMRQIRIAQLSAETDQVLAATNRSLARIEAMLAASAPNSHFSQTITPR